MKCPVCGETVKREDTRCPSCGMALQQGTGGVRPASPPPIAPQMSPEAGGLRKKEFYASRASQGVKSSLRAAAVILYICAIMNLIVGYIPDAAIILVLALVIHLRGSRVCVVILLVYSLFSCIVTTLARGTPSGWLLVIAGIAAVRGAFALEKEYRTFQGQ